VLVDCAGEEFVFGFSSVRFSVFRSWGEGQQVELSGEFIWRVCERSMGWIKTHLSLFLFMSVCVCVIWNGCGFV